MLNYWRQDTSLKIRNAVVTFGSCGLSGYSGWLIATDLGPVIQIITAVLFSCIAYNLSEAVVSMARYRLSRDQGGYYRNLGLALSLLVPNLMTDYSASITLRDLSKTQSENKNLNASMALKEVRRIEGRIEELTTEGGARMKLRPSAAYDGLIEAKRSAVKIEAAKVKCWTECQKLKDELAALVSLRASAKELEDLRASLPTAKAAVKSTPKVSNPAIAPIVALVDWAKLFVTGGKSEIKWGLNSFVLLITVSFSCAIWYLSSEIGNRAGPMRPPEPIQPRERKPDFWARELPAPAGHQPEPIPLRAESIPAETTSSLTVNYTGSKPPSVDRLQAMIAELDAKRGAA